jgi:hypothetical protein
MLAYNINSYSFKVAVDMTQEAASESNTPGG